MSDEPRSGTGTFANPAEASVGADLALSTGEHQDVGVGVVSVVVPQNAQLRLVDGEALAVVPMRPRGEAKPGTVEALVAYCLAHNDSTTEVWVNTERIVAVLNANAGVEGGVGWGDHRAVLALQHTPEWQHWIKLDGQMVGQAQFAEHIEEGILDIVEPASAQMLEIAQHFNVSRSATFRSSQHLQSGLIGFQYVESEHSSGGGEGGFEIPKEFKLGIPVYEGEQAYSLTARFRYRVTDGNLTLGYKLDRPDVVKRDAAEQIASRLEEQEGAFAHVYHGQPSAAVIPGRKITT